MLHSIARKKRRKILTRIEFYFVSTLSHIGLVLMKFSLISLLVRVLEK